MNIWAITCDGNSECLEGLDESGCETQIWFLSIVLFGAGFLIWFVSFFCSVGAISVEVEDEEHVSSEYDASRQERSFSIAILTEIRDVDEIKKIFRRELEIQGNENESLCYFKVNNKS